MLVMSRKSLPLLGANVYSSSAWSSMSGTLCRWCSLNRRVSVDASVNQRSTVCHATFSTLAMLARLMPSTLNRVTRSKVRKKHHNPKTAVFVRVENVWPQARYRNRLRPPHRARSKPRHVIAEPWGTSSVASSANHTVIRQAQALADRSWHPQSRIKGTPSPGDSSQNSQAFAHCIGAARLNRA